MGLNLDGLVEQIWHVGYISCELAWYALNFTQELGLVKVYTKKRGEHPDLADPIVSDHSSPVTFIQT